jgi:uncharacterized protein YqeY
MKIPKNPYPEIIYGKEGNYENPKYKAWNEGRQAQLAQDETEMKEYQSWVDQALDWREEEISKAVEQAKQETAREIFKELDKILHKPENFTTYQALKAKFGGKE